MGNEQNFACTNGQRTALDDPLSCSLGIGYTNDTFSLFPFVSILGLLTNIYIIFTYFRQKKQSAKNNQATMNTLFFFLSIIDILTCLYWIGSSFFFKKAEDIMGKYQFCFVLSIFYLFIFTFDFCFLNCILYHFIKINSNPIVGILQPGKAIAKYFFFSAFCGVLNTLLCFYLDKFGTSPFVTCFIKTDFYTTKENFYVFLVIAFPLINVLFSIYQICWMIYKKLFEHDLKLKKLYHKNCLYIALVLCLYLPIFTDILITIVKTEHIEENKTLRWFTYFSSMLSCFIPLIVSVFRILQGLVRINWLHKYFKKRKMLKELQDTGKAITNNLTVSLTMEDDFERLERMALQNFMRDIFVGLSYCFENSIESDTYPNDDYMQHKITTESYKKILEDETIPPNSYLNVQFIEYAPQTFYDIRNNEDIDYHEMAKSFLPMYNQAGIRRSEGKSGTFFISTDDNKYMIKTLKYEELDIIRCKFLKEYAEYVKENKNTLLCPIYGIFKMIMLGGEDEVLIVVMRNLIGDFKDNIICKFDLKGSSFNRKEQFDPERVENKVMKDLNFDEYEKVLMISERKVGHLRSITSKDSKFLAKMELMDYSLFVVKLDLDKETSMAIFGKSIQEKQELAVSSLLGNSQDESITIRESLASVVPDNDKYKFYRKYLFSSLHSGKAYLIAIIDYFQYYNFAKLMETNYKSIIHPREDNSISCVRPDVYSERFIKFIEKITDVKGFINENNPNSSNEINSTERRNSNEQ